MFPGLLSPSWIGDELWQFAKAKYIVAQCITGNGACCQVRVDAGSPEASQVLKGAVRSASCTNAATISSLGAHSCGQITHHAGVPSAICPLRCA
jgi:hypothetical protein